MNIVERYKRFKSIVQDDKEPEKKEEPQGQSYREIRKTFSRELLNDIFYFRNNYDNIKEATVYNVMKKHEFKMDLVENEIKMMVIGKKKFQKTVESQPNSKHVSASKYTQKDKHWKSKKKAVQADGFVRKDKEARQKKTSKPVKLAKWTDQDTYTKSQKKVVYQKKSSPESLYRPKNAQGGDIEYVKKKGSVKRKRVQNTSNRPNKDALLVNKSKVELDTFNKAFNKLKFLFKVKLFCSFKEIKETTGKSNKRDSPKQKQTESRYRKKVIGVAREFVNDLDESSVNEKRNWVNRRIAKEFESEDERMRRGRERKLETKVNKLKEIIGTMQNRINELEIDVAKLSAFSNQEQAKKQSLYCLVPFDSVQHLFTPNDDNKNSVETSDAHIKLYDFNRSGS